MLHSIPGGKNPHPRPKSIEQSSASADEKGVHNLNTLDDDQVDRLSDVITETRHMASILASLLEDRIADTGKGKLLTVGRRDAADIQFAARKVVNLVDRVERIWRDQP